METKRHIFIGDIHGMADEFNELLDRLKYNPKEDRLILVGDLIDRGPKSVELIRQVREMNLESTMGNHEAKFLSWYRNKGTRNDVYTPQPYYNQLSDADINYIAQMPLYIKLPDVLVVHAGIRANISIENQRKEDLLYLRFINVEGKAMGLRKVQKVGKENAHVVFWSELGPFGTNIVCGHNVHSYKDIRIDDCDDHKVYSIDTGGCFGGRLTALIWESKEVVQVQAFKTYQESNIIIP